MISSINIISTTVVSAMGAVGLAAGVGIADIFGEKERSIALVDLNYTAGYFIQSHKVEGGPIKGYWSAEIMRGNHQLCSGGGEAPYETGVKQFNPDDWTGADCPELKEGDEARAVWEYRLRSGAIASITGIVIIENP